MQLDGIITKNLRIIQDNIKDKYGRDFSIDDLKRIVNSQFKDLDKHMDNEEEIKIDYIGKIKIKEGRKYFLDKEKNEQESE